MSTKKASHVSLFSLLLYLDAPEDRSHRMLPDTHLELKLCSRNCGTRGGTSPILYLLTSDLRNQYWLLEMGTFNAVCHCWSASLMANVEAGRSMHRHLHAAQLVFFGRNVRGKNWPGRSQVSGSGPTCRHSAPLSFPLQSEFSSPPYF